jgi:ubiquinone/menaquinone biosynthesis C-methylase UbiE
MLVSEDLKRMVRERWSDSARVTHYCREVPRYIEGECPDAWCNCLAKALAGEGELNILDVGTGPGMFACLYARMGHNAWGLDFSTTMLDRARQLAAELKVEPHWILADAENPPFPEESFDAVSSRSMIQMLPRPGLAIHRWVRILRPGGKLILIGNRSHGRGRRRSIIRSVRRWLSRRPSGYSDAGDKAWESVRGEFPLPFQTPSNVFAALMDAAGLQDVHLHPSDDIYPAQQRTFTGKRGLTVPMTNPWILVGTKPE